MMQFFRNNAKFAVGLFVVLTLAWLLSSVGDSANQITQSSDAGVIAGQPVDARAYEGAVQQAVSEAQRGGQSLSLEGQEQVRNQVWDQFVERVLLEKEYEKRRITVSDEEVVGALRSAPPQELQAAAEFKTDGAFDLEKYRRWLVSASAVPYVEGLGSEYRDRLRRAKLFRQVAADVVVPDAALWEQYKDENEKVKVGIAAFLPDALVPDSLVTPTPTELEQHFAAHKADFKPIKTLHLSFVSLPRFTDASDTTAAATRAAALRTEIAGGTPFAEVAKRESADSVSAAKGGDLGEFSKGQMDPAFEAAAFALPIGTLSQPVVSSFGVHLIEVSKKTGDKITARHILVPVELAGAHRELVDARTDSLDRLAADQGDPAALDTAAKALGVKVERAAPTPEGGRVMAGPLAVPDAGIWAMTAKKGSISPVCETPYMLYVFRVDSIAGGSVTLAGVKSQVARAVLLEKKKAKVEAAATAVLARLVTGTALADAAKGMNAPFSEFGPFTRLNPPITDPVVVGAAFGLTTGQTSGLVRAREGGVYLLNAIERTPADSAAFAVALPALRTAALQQRQQERVQNFVAQLRAAAKIEDNRQKLRQQAAGAS
jgi:peptidyl-prolyl cis-trans isomerase D